jgi:hypothetical protein
VTNNQGANRSAAKQPDDKLIRAKPSEDRKIRMEAKEEA